MSSATLWSIAGIMTRVMPISVAVVISRLARASNMKFLCSFMCRMLRPDHDTTYCSDGVGVKVGDEANENRVNTETFTEATEGNRGNRR